MPKSPQGNHKETRQERRSKRKANRRKMAVHGRGVKKQPKKPAK